LNNHGSEIRTVQWELRDVCDWTDVWWAGERSTEAFAPYRGEKSVKGGGGGGGSYSRFMHNSPFWGKNKKTLIYARREKDCRP